MARLPATGWRWQAQPEAHSPRPQPEMTTVRPSSRILPTWKTDGLRLLVNGVLQSTIPSGAGPVCTLRMNLDEISAEPERYWNPGREIRPMLVGWPCRRPDTERN